MKNPLYIVQGKVKIRDDNGNTVGLQPPVPLISFNGRYYPLTHLTSIVGILPEQVDLTDLYQDPPSQAYMSPEQVAEVWIPAQVPRS